MNSLCNQLHFDSIQLFFNPISIQMKTLCFKLVTAICFVASCIPSAWSTNFFVDPSSLSSTSNGTLIAPWKSVSQVSSTSYNFKPGDTVFFRSGQVFSGRLTNTLSTIDPGHPFLTIPSFGTINVFLYFDLQNFNLWRLRSP